MTPLEKQEVVILYVCPNPNCGSYYGSSSMGMLEYETSSHSDNPRVIPHARNQCPNCQTLRERRFARLVPKDEQAEAEKEARSRILGAKV